MVMRKWSRKTSAGVRSTQGPSVRKPRQNFANRHRKAGTQVTPDSISTTLSLGYSANTPSLIRLAVCDWRGLDERLDRRSNQEQFHRGTRPHPGLRKPYTSSRMIGTQGPAPGKYGCGLASQ